MRPGLSFPVNRVERTPKAVFGNARCMVSSAALPAVPLSLCACLFHSPAANADPLRPAVESAGQGSPCQVVLHIYTKREGKSGSPLLVEGRSNFSWLSSQAQSCLWQVIRDVTPLVLGRPLKLCNFLDWKDNKVCRGQSMLQPSFL